jgi:integrase
MPPATASALAPDLLAAYLAYLRATGRGNSSFLTGARGFFRRWPDPEDWAREPLEVRLAAKDNVWPLLNFLTFQGHLRPGYDYLVERKLTTLWRELTSGPWAIELARFQAAAEALGYGRRTRTGTASQVAARLLIQTHRPLAELTERDFADFEDAIAARERRDGRPYKHYRSALYRARTVIYHLGSGAEPKPKASTQWRWSWERHLEGVPEPIRTSMVRYLECCVGTHARTTVSGMATRLAHFGRHLAAHDPALTSLAELDRQRHIEPYLTAVATARNPRTGAAISASERRDRIFAVGNMLERISEWGWSEAPARQLIFVRDAPRLPRALPRYLPPDADRRLARALERSPNRLRADALLLQRATGLRIGELVDLELDCVHEVPGQGAWLKVPLGKLDTERMVPLDDETVDIVDRIVRHRSPGRPLRHARTGRLVEFLLTHQGRRVSVYTLRDELARASRDAGLDPVTPHQLRHTYATALVNAGVSLQALMMLLGHQTAEMSLRYGRLFDSTVRADYERALALAKERMGPVLPATSAPAPKGNWRELPLIKARLAGGYCLRTAAQGACAYANICEHCPNFRSESAFLPILATQRTDAEALAADAEARGWGDEAARHRRLVERLDLLLSRAEGQ